MNNEVETEREHSSSEKSSREEDEDEESPYDYFTKVRSGEIASSPMDASENWQNIKGAGHMRSCSAEDVDDQEEDKKTSYTRNTISCRSCTRITNMTKNKGNKKMNMNEQEGRLLPSSRRGSCDSLEVMSRSHSSRSYEYDQDPKKSTSGPPRCEQPPEEHEIKGAQQHVLDPLQQNEIKNHMVQQGDPYLTVTHHDELRLSNTNDLFLYENGDAVAVLHQELHKIPTPCRGRSCPHSNRSCTTTSRTEVFPQAADPSYSCRSATNLPTTGGVVDPPPCLPPIMPTIGTGNIKEHSVQDPRGLNEKVRQGEERDIIFQSTPVACSSSGCNMGPGAVAVTGAVAGLEQIGRQVENGLSPYTCNNHFPAYHDGFVHNMDVNYISGQQQHLLTHLEEQQVDEHRQADVLYSTHAHPFFPSPPQHSAEQGNVNPPIAYTSRSYDGSSEVPSYSYGATSCTSSSTGAGGVVQQEQHLVPASDLTPGARSCFSDGTQFFQHGHHQQQHHYMSNKGTSKSKCPVPPLNNISSHAGLVDVPPPGLQKTFSQHLPVQPGEAPCPHIHNEQQHFFNKMYSQPTLPLICSSHQAYNQHNIDNGEKNPNIKGANKTVGGSGSVTGACVGPSVSENMKGKSYDY